MNTGGPAFPRPASEAHQHGMHRPQEGMTLRDYFAAKAMQALLIKGVIPAEGLTLKQATVNMAYETADEMLKAREQ